MTAKELQKLENFLSGDRNCFKHSVLMLLKDLEKKTTFSLKIQKASIQICSGAAFAVMAFRRSKPYYFIEFYHCESIKSPRIIKSFLRTENLTINRIIRINRTNITSSKEIDNELLNWILKSELIVKDSQQ